MSEENNNANKVQVFETLHMKEDMELHGIVVANKIEGHNDKVFDLKVYGMLIVDGDAKVRDLMVEDLFYIKGNLDSRNVRAQRTIGGQDTKANIEGRIDSLKIDLTNLSVANVDSNTVKMSYPIKLTTKDGKIVAGMYTIGHSSLMIKKEWNPDGTEKSVVGLARKEEHKSKNAR